MSETMLAIGLNMLRFCEPQGSWRQEGDQIMGTLQGAQIALSWDCTADLWHARAERGEEWTEASERGVFNAAKRALNCLPKETP